MSKIKDFKINNKWPANNENIIQLYSMATPNGVKVSIALEELGLQYEVHKVDINKGLQKSPEFVSLNPNGRIPAIIDPDGPDGKPIELFESAAILMYLAEKTGKLISKTERGRWECIQWLFFQMGAVGPMFGQFGHFYKYAADKITDEYPKTRYTEETKRILSVLDRHLEGKKWLAANEYSIADIATFPWIYCIIEFYNGAEIVELESFKNVMKWYEAAMSRKAVQKGIKIPE